MMEELRAFALKLIVLLVIFHSFYLHSVVDLVVGVVAAIVVDFVFHFVYLHFSETFLLRLLHIRLISY